VTTEEARNGERAFGHAIITNLTLVWIMLGCIVGAGVTWGGIVAANNAEHQEVRRELSGLHAQCKEFREAVVQITHSLGRIEARLDLNMIGGGT
jgi:hypothetical protein